METVLNLPSLDIYIKREARLGEYKQIRNANWRDHKCEGAIITTVVVNPLFDIGSDYIIPRIHYDKSFKVTFNWKEWISREMQLPRLQVWYTYESRRDANLEVSIYGEALRYNLSMSLGQYATFGVLNCDIPYTNLRLRKFPATPKGLNQDL